MKTFKIILARNKENELYKGKHYWLVLNAPIVADFNAPGDTGCSAGMNILTYFSVRLQVFEFRFAVDG